MFDWQPVYLSLKIASVAAIIIAFAGLSIGVLFTRCDFFGKELLETLLSLPLAFPPVVTGFVLLLLLGRQGPVGKLLENSFHLRIVFSPLAAVIAAVVVSFPLMYQSTKAALKSVDYQFEDAARSLGAGEMKIFFTITLPLAWPGIIAGMVMAFSRSLGEFGATAMVAGNIPGRTQTIPVAIYFAAESNNLTQAGCYVLVLSLITFTLLFWVNRWSKRKTIKLTVDKRDTDNVKCCDQETVAQFST